MGHRNLTQNTTCFTNQAMLIRMHITTVQAYEQTGLHIWAYRSRTTTLHVFLPVTMFLTYNLYVAPNPITKYIGFLAKIWFQQGGVEIQKTNLFDFGPFLSELLS